MTTIQYKNEITGHRYREEQLDEKDRPHGYNRIFDPKGTLLYEDWFSKGELHGSSVSYKNGKVITFNTFKNGECTTSCMQHVVNDFRLWWNKY